MDTSSSEEEESPEKEDMKARILIVTVLEVKWMFLALGW